jgi:hypothetical protein
MGFIARIFAILAHGATDASSSSGSDLNTQDEREYRQYRPPTVGHNEELRGAAIRESLDNLRW